jgi:proteasome accessory factor B
VEKLERLLNLTVALLETLRPLSAEEIGRRVPGYPDPGEAFHRAFERDKEDLREMGIPISLSEIPGTDPPADGYRIRKEDYYLDDPGLDPDELAALRLASTAVRLDGIQGVEGLWKLGGLVGEAEPPVPMSAIPTDPRLADLFAAVTERAAVTFRYRDEERTVEPHRIDYQRGRWYLTGHDRLRGEQRNFRIDRIEGGVAVGPGGAFERPEGQRAGRPAQPWEFGEGEPITARLAVDGDHALWAVRHLGEAAVVEHGDDDSVVVEVPVTDPGAFRSFVVTFLDHAELLGPPELRADLVAWLEEMAR